MEKNKTAVQWLLTQISFLDWNHLQDSKKLEIFEQAKEIEREQIMHAWKDGSTPDEDLIYYAERYYEETYGE